MVPRLLAWFVAGLFVFNFPLLGLWDKGATLWGMPLFPLAMFALWAALIIGTAVLLENDGVADGPEP